MNRNLKLTERELGMFEGCLDELYMEYISLVDKVALYSVDEKPYSIQSLGNDKYDFYLTDEFAEFAKTADHNCTATPDDGCWFCSFLIDLGLMPDVVIAEW